MDERERNGPEAPAPESERAVRCARRALAEAAAATAVLLDRDAWPASAIVHVLEGFGALADALAPGSEGTVSERIAACRIAGMGDAELAALASSLVKLADAPRDRADAVKRAEVRRLARTLHLASARVLRAHGERGGRWTWVAAGAVALLLAVALAWGGSASKLSGDARGSGWLGRYYPELDFRGEPVIRYDEKIDFDWLKGAPVEGIPPDRFTVRWDTCLDVSEDEMVNLRIGSDDGSRVLLDGERVIDSWQDQAGNWSSYQAPLSAGVHHLRVEYYENGGNALAIFEVTGSAGPVPLDRFRPPQFRGGDVACSGD